MSNLANCLKNPPDLADRWLDAVIKTTRPLVWDQAFVGYWPALLRIKSDAELLQVQGAFLADWPTILFGNQPVDAGLSLG